MKYNERGKSRIEVSDILNYFKDIDSYYNDCTRYDTLKRMLEDIVAETKEDAERKKGKWIVKERREPVYDISGVKTWGIAYMCSECGFIHTVIEDFGQYAYCPNSNCGAEMEGQDDRK